MVLGWKIYFSKKTKSPQLVAEGKPPHRGTIGRRNSPEGLPQMRILDDENGNKRDNDCRQEHREYAKAAYVAF